VADEVLEQGELAAGQLNRRVAAAHAAGQQIEL
jgi:hypothetical protein